MINRTTVRSRVRDFGLLVVGTVITIIFLRWAAANSPRPQAVSNIMMVIGILWMGWGIAQILLETVDTISEWLRAWISEPDALRLDDFNHESDDRGRS